MGSRKCDFLDYLSFHIARVGAMFFCCFPHPKWDFYALSHNKKWFGKKAVRPDKRVSEGLSGSEVEGWAGRRRAWDARLQNVVESGRQWGADCQQQRREAAAQSHPQGTRRESS